MSVTTTTGPARDQPAGVPSVSAAGPGAGRCPNCGAEALQPYCGWCGQSQEVRPPTLRTWVAEFLNDVFDVNGLLPRTLSVLVRRPGELTAQWFAGRRASYVPPMRLYILCSLAMFGLGIALRYIGVRYGVGYVPQGAVADEAVAETARRSATHALFVLVPLFALWLKLLFWRTGHFYVEHFTFTLHAHAFAFIAVIGMYMLVFLPDSVSMWVRLVFPLATLVYLVLALRRVYGESPFRSAWKGVLLFAVHSLAVLTLTLALTEYRVAAAGERASAASESEAGTQPSAP